MGNLFHSQQPAAFQEPQALGVDLNTSNYGRPINVVYGTNKTSGNCVWYGDFNVTTQSQGGKGGGGVSSYDYHASYMLVMCEGPITAFGDAWQGSSYQPLSNLDPAFTTLGNIGQAAWSHFSGVQALGYSGWSLIAFLNNDLGGQATTPNYQIEVGGLQQFGSGIVDAAADAIITDICTNIYHGINFAYLGDMTQFHDYVVANGLFISPVYNSESTGNATIADILKVCNTAAYFSEGLLKFVPYGDIAVTGHGVTYTPNLTLAAEFTDADYVQNQSAPPVQLTRKALVDCSNTVRVQYPDRAYYYYDEMVEARDQQDAITNGVRAMSSQDYSSITTAAVARFVAQNVLQRELYIRNTYEFRVSWRFAFLEPTDPVTLTDSTMGFTNILVRLTKVEENEDGSLSMTAEELPIGVGHSENYNTQANAGATLDILADPGPVTDPVLFRAPGFLTSQASPQIGVAVAAVNPLWGGAQMFISYDGANFFYQATISFSSRYGLLTAALPLVADPDTTSTAQVELEVGTLNSSTDAAADNLQTLSLVDGELIAYGSSALVSGTTYNLSYFRRACYNTAAALHSIGATFIRLDNNITYFDIDPSYIGKTIYVKFLSYNVFGKTPRTLAEETSYSYVVGTNTNLPDVPDVPGSFAVLPVADGVNLTWSLDNPAAVKVVSIEYSPDDATWTVLSQVGNNAASYHHAFVTGATYYYRIRAQGSLPQAGFSAYTSVISSTGKTVANGATIGAQLGTNLVQADGATVVSTLDQIPDGSGYAKVGVGSLTSNNVDLGRSGVLGRTGANIVYTDGGNTLDSFKPEELGANITENRTSALTKSLSNQVISDNLVQNPNFVNGSNGWYFQGSGWTVSGGSTHLPVGNTFAQCDTSTQVFAYGTSLIPIDFSKTYLMECWLYCSDDTAQTSIGFMEYDGDGNQIVHDTGTYAYPMLSTGLFTGYTYFSAEVSGNGGTTSPPMDNFNGNARSIVPILQLDGNNVAGVQYVLVQFKISEVAAGARRGLQSTTPGSGNYKAYSDFTDNTVNGHVGKNLDNFADGVSGNRNAVLAVDGNKRPYIDFSQAAHLYANVQHLGGVQSGTCYDGQAVTFSPSYDVAPRVILQPGGTSYSASIGPTVSHGPQFTAASLTTSGFTASLKLVSGGSTTAQSNSFTAVSAGREYNVTLASAPAISPYTFTVNWTLTMSVGSSCTVNICETNTSGTNLYSHNFVAGQAGSKSTSVTWSGATSSSVLDISITDVLDGTATISASTVTYTTGTAPTSATAVTSDAPINWMAYPAT